MNIIFMGTPKFGAIVLKGLVDHGYKPMFVVTTPDKQAGRNLPITPPPVKTLAASYGIRVLQPEKIISIKNQIAKSKPDLVIIAAYGQIIPKDILQIAKFGCLNVHPSLLPKYRGASPIETAILNGERETGATIMQLDELLDHGPLLAQETVQINSTDTKDILSQKLAQCGAELLVQVIPQWIAGSLKAKKQDEHAATFTKIITKEDGKIDWQKSAQAIEHQIRAFHPWPDSFTFWKKNATNQLRIKILKAEIAQINDKGPASPGQTLLTPQKFLLVRCGQGFLLIRELQLEGKKPQRTDEFLQGHQDFIGTILV